MSKSFFERYWIYLYLALYLPLAYMIYGHTRLLDDNYIYLQYARHFVEHGELSFNLGEKSYAFTSPLWQIIYIIFFYFVRSSYIAPFLSLSFAVAAILFCYFSSKDLFKEKLLLLPVIIIISFDPIFIKHIFNGMETTCASFISYLIVLGVLISGKIKKEFSIGVIFGLFLLVRPESLILFLLILLYFLLSGRFTLKGLLKITASAAIVCLPWLLFAYFYFGKLLPDTFGAKGGDYPLGASFFKNLFDLFKIFGGNYLSLFIISLFSIKKFISFYKGDKLKYFLLFMIVVSYVLFYSLVISNETIYARYLFIPASVIILFFILFIKDVSVPLSSHKLKYFLAAFLLIITSIFYSRLDKQLVENTKVIQSSIIRWVIENTPQDSYISYGVIGKLGYETQRKIFDPQGLINRDISRYFASGRIEEYYQLKKPGYLIHVPEITVNKLRPYADIELKKEFVSDSRSLLRQIINIRPSIDTCRIYKLTWLN
jgi:hypothetical protein